MYVIFIYSWYLQIYIFKNKEIARHQLGDSTSPTNRTATLIDHVLTNSSHKVSQFGVIPAGIYLLKVKNRNTRTRCEINSKLTIKTPERR